MRRFSRIFGSLLLAMMGARHPVTSAATSASLQPPLEQLHDILAQRHAIEHYTLETRQDGVALVFQLRDGRRLSYDRQGNLRETREPDARELAWKDGLPLRLTSGGRTETTQYDPPARDGTTHSVTRVEKGAIERWHAPDGTLLLELVRSPEEWLFRWGFYLAPLRNQAGYWETSSRTGLTDLVMLHAESNRLQARWVVTGGLRQDVTLQYTLFSRLLAQHLHARFTDTRRQRQDSTGRTRGEYILVYLASGSAISPSAFHVALDSGRIQLNASWTAFDCRDVQLVFPKLDLRDVSPIHAARARMVGEELQAWSESKRTWEPYVFNPENDRLEWIHGGRGEVRVVAKQPQRAWTPLPGQQEVERFTGRLAVEDPLPPPPPARLSNRWYWAMDRDARIPLAVQPGPIQPGGEHPGSAFLSRIGPFRQALFSRAMAEVLARPEFQQRDSMHRRKSDLIIAGLWSGDLLNRTNLWSQRERLWLREEGGVQVVEYRDLQVEVPSVAKQPQYRLLERARRVPGRVDTWMDDPELPEGGYWQPYALRQERDRLLDIEGRLMIRVDQSAFHWMPTGRRQTITLSGSVVLPPALDARVSRQRSAVTRAQSKIRPSWADRIQAWFRWLPGEDVLPTAPGNERRVLLKRRRGWFGHPRGYVRELRENDRRQVEVYDAGGRLLRFTDQNGGQGTVLHQQPGEVTIRVQGPRGPRVFHFRHGRLIQVHANPGAHWTVSYEGETVLLRRWAENTMLHESRYDALGRLTSCWTPEKTVLYDYFPTQPIIIRTETFKGGTPRQHLVQGGPSRSLWELFQGDNESRFFEPARLDFSPVEFKLFRWGDG